MVDHLEVLPRRMNNFQWPIATQESGDRCEVKTREWINTGGLKRRRNLNQAKPGIVRSNPFELSINTNPGRTRHVLTELLQFVGCLNKFCHGLNTLNSKYVVDS